MRSLALLIVVAGCGGDAGGGPDAAPASSDAYQLCVDKTNQLRATVGKPALTRSATLEAFANAGAEYDFTRSPHDHFKTQSGGALTAWAENECPHWDLSFGGGDEVTLVSKCIDAFWSEGPGGGHYENMIGAYTTLGCGIYHSGTDYTIIQDYAQ